MSLLPREQWFDMDHFFDNFFPAKTKANSEKAFFSPKVDIIDKGDNYQIIAELPGVNKDDVSVQLHDGILTIEAKTCEESSSDDDKVIRKERRTGYFSRSFTLGNNVSANDINATFDKGLLTLTAPKLKEQEVEKRNITIS